MFLVVIQNVLGGEKVLLFWSASLGIETGKGEKYNILLFQMRVLIIWTLKMVCYYHNER
jgi:hypothetical protein